MATSPQFEGLRKNQKEFGGCTKFASMTRYAFGGLHRLADYNLTPVLTGMAKNLIKLDTTFPLGQRRIQLSQHTRQLEGFQFNRTYPFNTVVRVGISGVIDRQQLTATVTVPRLNTDVDLLNMQRLPCFLLIAVLGTVADKRFNEGEQAYEPAVADLHGASEVVNSEWFPSQAILPEQTLTIDMGEARRALLTDEVSVLLSIGVEFGTVGITGEAVEVKYAGCGKVLAVR